MAESSNLSNAVLIALDRDAAKQFFGHREDASRLAYVQELAGDALDISASWRALHACLGDGTLNPEAEFPLGACILGGRQLQRAGDAVVSLLRPDMVPAVASALADFPAEALEERFNAADETVTSNATLDAVRASLQEVTTFYQSAADAGAAKVFAAW